jgi:hypothetical protein
VFCSTCLKNQRLYTLTLAESLPDPDHPKYRQFEKVIPSFKRKLDDRYPQCCAGCEPRVRERLTRANYDARADHVRRMLERSRRRRVGSRWGWRRVVVNLAGMLYLLSLAVQLLWHLAGAQSTDVLGTCLQRPVPTTCVKGMEKYVGASLVVGLLTSWWNPKWDWKLREEGRLVGLSLFYRAQVILLSLRFAAWTFAWTHRTHAVSLLTIAIWSGIALCTVSVDTTPLVNWDYEQPDLVSPTQYVPPPRTFDIQNLAPTQRPQLEQWRPPTPPSNDDMDWQPSYTFNPVKIPRYRDHQPFQGTVPAVGKKTAIGLPPGHFDNRAPLPQKQRKDNIMADPKFFPPDADTGLESIFGQVFSLNDPVERETIPTVQRSSAPLVSAALLVLAVVLWSISDILSLAIPNARVYILTLSLIPALRAVPKLDILAIVTIAEVALLLTIAFHPNQFTDKAAAGLLTVLAVQEGYAWMEAIPGTP